jgi:copper(I)-binding protein
MARLRGALPALAWMFSTTCCAWAAPEDTALIKRAIEAEFGQPDRPLVVHPVSVRHGFAIAGWTQGNAGGRALLQQHGTTWQIVLCGGDALLQQRILSGAGIPDDDAAPLLVETRTAEASLPLATRQRFAGFTGVIALTSTAQREHAAGVTQTTALLTSPAWARATPPGISVAAVYVDVTNAGHSADTLLSASSPVAARVELHRSTVDNGMSRMRPVDAIGLPAGAVMKIEPGGLHLMLTGLKQPLVAGAPVPLTLQFRQAGAIDLQVAVIPLTAAGPDAAAGHDHTSHQH